MSEAKLLALHARMLSLQARLEALKWANVQDSHGMAYTPDHFFAVESELSEVALAIAGVEGVKR